MKEGISSQRLKYNFNFFINNLLREKSLRGKSVLNKPHFISLMIEDRCCLRCQQCDVWMNEPVKKRLTLSQQKMILRKLKKWLGGTFGLNISGGEPFLNKDTIPLIKYASQNEILVHINTNAVLIDRDLGEKLVKSGVDAISVSLESFKPAVHDRLRGLSGTCKKALEAVSYMNKLRYQVDPSFLLNIGTIIMDQNLDELVKMVRWVKKNGLNGIFFQPLKHNFTRKPYDFLWYEKSNLWPKNTKKLKKTIDKLIELKRKGLPILNSVKHLGDCKLYYEDPLEFAKSKPCLVGIGNFIISIIGDVRLCFEMEPVGNILKQEPEEIWLGKKAENQRKVIRRCSKGCRVSLCNTPGEAHELFLAKVKESNLLF